MKETNAQTAPKDAAISDDTSPEMVDFRKAVRIMMAAPKAAVQASMDAEKAERAAKRDK